MALRPGGSSEPETMAATVSRMWCFASSITLSGSARLRASLMYVLRSVITGLMDSAAAIEDQDRNIPAAITQPDCCNILRRVLVPLFRTDRSDFRSYLMLVAPSVRTI